MTAPAYARGFTGLAAYLDVDQKTARKIDREVSFPKIEIPGLVRPTTLFRLVDVDAALDRYRQEGFQEAPSVDISALVEEITGKKEAR